MRRVLICKDWAEAGDMIKQFFTVTYYENDEKIGKDYFVNEDTAIAAARKFAKNARNVEYAYEAYK